MVRELVLGNGNLLVCIDKNAMIRDFYYPYVGHENQVQGNKHRIGVYVDGKLSWLDEPCWEIKSNYKKDTLVSEIEAINKELEVKLLITDAVHPSHNFYLREIKVYNLKNQNRKIKVFLYQYFTIYETDFGITAFYQPLEEAIIFYKGRRYFLASGKSESSFDDYAVGRTGKGLEGTYFDAIDGELSKNPVEHGNVDSTLGFTLNINKNSKKDVYYWIAAGRRYQEVVALHNLLLKKDPSLFIRETEKYWKRWISKTNKIKGLKKLDKKIVELFKRSLLIIRTHVDNRGGIIASGDSDIIKYLEYEDYSYVWPRDAAFAALALDRTGYHSLVKKFLLFCNRIITKQGYVLHKYNNDGSAASSWHSWIKYGMPRIPIQEDETAMVLYLLYKNYESVKNKAFLRKVYNNLIKNPAEFMASYRYKKLPNESYDIWEEKFGIHTYTSCIVSAALRCAAKLVKDLKKPGYMKYLRASKEIKEAVVRNLYDKEKKVFLKRKHFKEEGVLREYYRVDYSTGFGLTGFDVFDIENKIVKETMKLIEEKLTCKTAIGGVARYEGDQFQRVDNDNKVPGNPWFICTLWLAQYYIAKAKNRSDLRKAEELINLVTKLASPTGMLSEQFNPFTGELISAAPLAWSHAPLF